MKASTIQKYQKLPISKLKLKAQKVFNAWIRERDKDTRCISCGTGPIQHACHFYSGGHYNALRFDPDNVHGGCLRCNYFLSGNLNEYRKNLVKRIGQERLEELDRKAVKKAYKWDRYTLIDLIEKYSLKKAA